MGTYDTVTLNQTLIKYVPKLYIHVNMYYVEDR